MRLVKKKVIISILLLLFALVITGGWSLWSLFNNDKIVDEKGKFKDRINILLLGIDSKLDIRSRADTIILASLDTQNKKISLLSIPRDTLVDIPGHRENRINAANQLGGIELMEETVTGLLGIPLDYYVVTNFEGFKNIVDTLGGVEIDVEKDMKCRVYDGQINIKKGLQRLNGETALQYVRFRRDQLGDISRTQRQQKFLFALAKEVFETKNPVKLSMLVPQLRDVVETDMGLKEMVALGRDFKNYDLSSMTVQTLPGNFASKNGVDYWFVDKGKTLQIVQQVFSGQTEEDIIDPSIKISGGGRTKKSSKKAVEQPMITPDLPSEQPGELPVVSDQEKEPSSTDQEQSDTISQNEENTDQGDAQEENEEELPPDSPDLNDGTDNNNSQVDEPSDESNETSLPMEGGNNTDIKKEAEF